MTTRPFTVWRKSDISFYHSVILSDSSPQPCHPERSNCFRLRKQLRSRKPALSAVEGDLLLCRASTLSGTSSLPTFRTQSHQLFIQSVLPSCNLVSFVVIDIWY